MSRRGRARNDAPKASPLPKTEKELAELLERTWQNACDAEFARADEEYRTLRAVVLAFDSVVLAGKSAWDRLGPPRLSACSVQDALDFAARVREIIDAEPRLKALDAFEAVSGLKIDSEHLARLDGKAVKALHAEPNAAGLILNRLKISLEQLEAGRRQINDVVESMEMALRETP